jgi:hypothetical protein
MSDINFDPDALDLLVKTITNNSKFFPASDDDDLICRQRIIVVSADGTEEHSLVPPFKPIYYEKVANIVSPNKTEIMKCPECGKEIKRKNLSRHRKTQLHHVYAQMNDRLRQIVLSIPV